MPINRQELAAALRYFADKVEKAEGAITIEFPQPAITTPPAELPVRPVPPAPGNFLAPTAPADNPLAPWWGADNGAQARHQFDHTLPWQPGGPQVPTLALTAPGWIEYTTATYGSLDNYVRTLSVHLGRAPDNVRAQMRAIFGEAKLAVPAWLAQP